jgi:outer membrane protein TolC
LLSVLKLAQERNLTIAQARERANEQRANLAGARAELLPNLKFDTGIGRTLGNISNIADVPNARATLFLNPARSIFTAKAVGRLTQASEADLQSATQGTLLTAIVQYYDLLRAQGRCASRSKPLKRRSG